MMKVLYILPVLAVLGIVVDLGISDATASNAPPQLIESPTEYYLRPPTGESYYVGKVPIPEVVAVDDQGSVSTHCEKPEEVTDYWGAGNYRYRVGTYEILCYITDGTYQVNFSYDLIIIDRGSTRVVYPSDKGSNPEVIPHWVHKYGERYCNDRLSTSQMLAVLNYLDRHGVLDLDWDGLDSTSVYSVDFKTTTCGWTNGHMTDVEYQSELRKLKDDPC